MWLRNFIILFILVETYMFSHIYSGSKIIRDVVHYTNDLSYCVFNHFIYIVPSNMCKTSESVNVDLFCIFLQD